MPSISATASASALRNLQAISKELATTQNRVSTGLKVASAQDNASIWATSEKLRADIKGEEDIKGDMTIATGRASVASVALETVAGIITKMKNVIDRAQANGDQASANTAVGDELAPLQAQLMATLKGASFQGQNWLMDAGGAKDVAIFRDNGSAINQTYTAVQFLTTAGTGGSLYNGVGKNSVYTMDIDNTTVIGDINTMETTLDTALTSVNTKLADLSNFTKALEAQDSFISKISEIRKTALSNLVDADMTAESTRLQALQVREQLTYQTLSMINQSASNVLALFR